MGAGAIKQFQKRWQQSKYVEGMLYAVGFGGFVYLLTQNIFLELLVFGFCRNCCFCFKTLGNKFGKCSGLYRRSFAPGGIQ